MERAGPDKSADFYGHIAADYDRQMAGKDDAWIRTAFWAFVEARVPRDATLLDFGCGTGVDALHYASRGGRVLAYDNSAGMVDALRVRCAGEIARGAIDAWSCPYEGFAHALSSRGRVDAVTANFAAVNHLPDMAAWLDGLAGCTTPGAGVLVSSLNACPLSALRDRGFWGRAVKHGTRAGIPSASDAFDLVRYWPWSVGRGSRAFRVASRAGVGAIVGAHTTGGEWRRPTSPAERLERASWQTFPAWLLGRFTFVELRRRG